MLTKTIISALIATGFIGAFSISVPLPLGIDVTAGPIKLEAGNGKIIKASLAQHSPFVISIIRGKDKVLSIKL